MVGGSTTTFSVPAGTGTYSVTQNYMYQRTWPDQPMVDENPVTLYGAALDKEVDGVVFFHYQQPG